MLLALLLNSQARALECPPALPAAGGQAREILLVLRERGAAEPEEPDAVLQTPDGRLWIGADVLSRWRVALPAESMEFSGARWYPLDATRARVSADDCAQALEVDLPASARTLARYALRTVPTSASPDTASPGGYLNLDLQHTRVPSGNSTAGLLDAGFFNGHGYGDQGFLVTDSRAVRLDSWWSMDDLQQPRTLRIGDGVSRPGVWGRSVRFGGVQWATDYGLLPFFPTFPLPTVSGEAALPSTLDVFVNQSLMSRRPVEPGPFELNDVPVVSGAGEVRVAVPDLLGRQTYLTQSYYLSPQLLREGLNDIALEGGWLRRNYGVLSDDYGAPFATLTQRHGETDRLTLETRLEMQQQQGALGESAYMSLHDFALASGTLAYGSGPRGSGLRAAAGLERQLTGSYTVFGQAQWAEPGFSQLGDAPGVIPPRWREIVGGSFAPNHGGSLSLSWIAEDRRAAADFSLLSLAYQTRLTADWSLFSTAQEIREGGRDYSVLLGLTWLPGQNRLAGVQSQRRSNEGYTNRAEFQQNLRKPLDYGYRMAVEGGAEEREFGSALWREEHGQLTADVASAPQGESYRFGAATALANLGDRFYWTRPLRNSFAVVDTGGLGGVQVYADNLPVGRTAGDGTLLVPDLRANQPNQFSLDADDVPLEATVPRLSRTAVPPTRGGVRVPFAVETRASALIRVRLPDGRALPSGATVLDTGTGDLVPVGAGGEIYVQAPAQPRLLRISWSGGSCVMRLGPEVAVSGETTPEVTCSLH